MQEVLIKIKHSTWHIADVTNHKFDEMLHIIEATFDHLKAQALIVEAYDSISKEINISSQKVFEILNELMSDLVLELEARPSHVRG